MTLEVSRRQLLASAGGVVLASFALPPSLRRVLGDAPAALAGVQQPAPAVSDIKHIVVLMQENRSFDHYFGTMPGVRGFGDKDALIQTSGPLAGKSVFYQQDNNPAQTSGYMPPGHLDTLTTGAQAIPSTSHAWLVQHSAYNNGQNNNWLP